MNERKGGGSDVFSLISPPPPFFLGNFACRRVPASRAGSLEWVIAVIVTVFLFSFFFLLLFSYHCMGAGRQAELHVVNSGCRSQ